MLRARRAAPVWFALSALVSYFVVERDHSGWRTRAATSAAVVQVILLVEVPSRRRALVAVLPELSSTPLPEESSVVSVNGVGHQTMVPTEAKLKEQPFYLVPYTGVSSSPQHYRHALVIGAGTGTDVAVALQQGVEQLDAVEIPIPKSWLSAPQNIPRQCPPWPIRGLPATSMTGAHSSEHRQIDTT